MPDQVYNLFENWTYLFGGAKSNECPEDILDNGGFRLRKMKDEGQERNRQR